MDRIKNNKVYLFPPTSVHSFMFLSRNSGTKWMQISIPLHRVKPKIVSYYTPVMVSNLQHIHSSFSCQNYNQLIPTNQPTNQPNHAPPPQKKNCNCINIYLWYFKGEFAYNVEITRGLITLI